MKIQKEIKATFTYTFLSVVSFICVFPFIWMFLGASMTSNEVISGTLKIGSNLGENLQILFRQVNFARSFLNSSLVALITTVLALFISSLAAYGFTVFSSRIKNKIFFFLVFTMMIPTSALMIPLYKLVIFLGLSNTLASIILPAVATQFLIFFFKQSFTNFSKEIIHAARIDGAHEFHIFINIVVPAMKPTYAAAAILTFMTSWNSFLWPLITLSTRNLKTLPLLINVLSDQSYDLNYGVILLAVTMATLPSIFVFFTLQKHFIAGFIGAMK